MAHVLQVLTEMDPQTSIDGVGAHDSISRKAMLEALMAITSDFSTANLPGICGKMNVATSTTYIRVRDALMPLVFWVRLFAFLDDVCVTTTPNRVGTVHNILQEELHRHSRIHINIGKTQVWNAAGIRPPACDELERTAQLTDPDARVWKGSGLPTSEQGVRILGTPVGHPDFVQAFLRKVLEELDVLLSRIPRLRMCSRRGPSSCIVQVDARTTC